MTTVYVLLAECKQAGGVTADAFPTLQAAVKVGMELANCNWPAVIRIVRITDAESMSIDDAAELAVKRGK